MKKILGIILILCSMACVKDEDPKRFHCTAIRDGEFVERYFEWYEDSQVEWWMVSLCRPTTDVIITDCNCVEL